MSFVLAWMTLVASATPSDDGAAPVSNPEQIEADWLRQEVVRNLPSASNTLAGGAVSTHQDAAGGCDGVKDGTFGFHTGSDQEPWWQVDLGESLPLDRVVIYNRCDGNVQGRAARLEVRQRDGAPAQLPPAAQDQ